MAPPSLSRLPPVDGLGADFGFLLIRRQIDDWTTAVASGEPDQPIVASALDPEGRVVSVAMKQAGLPELPSFIAKAPPARMSLPARPLVVATVGDHALLLISGELFLYDSPPRLASLLLLPPHPRASDRNWMLHRPTTALASVDDTFVVASLRPPQLDSTGWGELHRWSSSTGLWDVKPLPGNAVLKVQRIDMTVALGNGTICWAAFSAGVVLVNVFEENPSIQYIPLPPSVASIADPHLYRKNTVAFVDGHLSLIATKKERTFGYEFLVFDLSNDTAVWVQKATISIPWAHSFTPWFPTFNAQDPRLIYFLEHGQNGMSYIHGLNTQEKSLSRQKQRVLFPCSDDEISVAAPWVGMQLSASNQGDPSPKRQRTP